MAVGQVSFHDDRKVKKVLVRERENAIINRLNKTKVEKHPDLKQEKDDRLRELRKKDQAAVLARVRSTSPLHVFPVSNQTTDLTRFLYFTEEGRGPHKEGEGGAETPEGTRV